MSNNNNEMQGAGLALGLMGAAFILMAIFIYAFLAFVAVIFTVLALLAWFRPLELFGQTIYPEEARTFVYRGLIGAQLLPAFLMFCELLLAFRFNWTHYGFHVVAIGYIIGSVGIEMMRDEQPANIAPVQPPPPVIKQLPFPPDEVMHSDAGSSGFRFGTWDDEEKPR